MSSVLFEQLENAGLLRGNKVNLRAVAAASPTALIDLALEAGEITSAEELPREPTVYAHFASVSLGGGRAPCHEIGCRSARAYEMAQFAALYSDKVYIKNFLADHIPHHDGSNPNPERLRKEFANDLTVLAQLRPLIVANHVVPITPPSNYCAHCLAKLSFGEDADRRFDAEYKRLIRRYSTGISVEVTNRGSEYSIFLRAPTDLLEHGGSGYIMTKLPPELLTVPTLANGLLPGESVRLSRKQGGRLSVHTHLAREVFESLTAEMAAAQSLGTTFLTERPLHIEILNALSADQQLERRNQLIQKHLTALVPLADGVDVANLLEVRKREEGAFQGFRQALNRAVDAVIAERGSLSERSARTIYSDLVAPQLANLDAQVRHGQRGLVKMTRRKALGWSAAITFGAYTGFGPAGLAAAATALGLTKVLAEFAETIMSKSDSEDELRNQEMYFLWKVRNVTTKSSESP